MSLQRGCDGICFTAIFLLIQIIRRICTGVNTVLNQKLFNVYVNGINTSCGKNISEFPRLYVHVACIYTQYNVKQISTRALYTTINILIRMYSVPCRYNVHCIQTVYSMFYGFFKILFYILFFSDNLCTCVKNENIVLLQIRHFINVQITM